MPRKRSAIAPDWWDYTTLDAALLADAARLTPDDLRQLSRPGFRVVFYDTLEEFYLAEALEYIAAWKAATADNPVGICGPIGPTEQLPLVARHRQRAGAVASSCALLGHGRVGRRRARGAGRRIRCRSRRPTARCASIASGQSCACPTATSISRRPTPRRTAKAGRRCALRRDAGRAGRSEALGVQRSAEARGQYMDAPPPPAEYRKLPTRVVDLHPMTIAQNARTSGGGNIALVPTQALTVGPGRDVEGREGLDLARRHARQPVRPAADDADDLEKDPGLRRADVAAGRSSERAVQLLPRAASGPATSRCTDSSQAVRRLKHPQIHAIHWILWER